ncbi:leucine--tRNA ligase [Blattabacterium sp. (Blaberus giganteus)]|uniref:leucine--tRNA ligase n=1 Tax=Blattabacterium sp. (Blaberus giganteus) TaxID=1186051 RepID=UPI00025F6FFF|nr:leucine--tRNA ligase [Blattabacterium sp. (Blaberus giganteus)]AFJ90933.1 leucine-tRNA ligase [Blattabacterium sp. (Blaberus giganteus)]
MEYNFREIEKRWQIYWKKHNIFHTKEDKRIKKYYILNMFPYPSGTGLHVGHCLGYIASDVYARYKRAEGYNVLNPIGFDSFGLPAEQYAIQTGKHPYDTICENSRRYKKQMNRIGLSFDWNRKIYTSNPNYYRWTQWIFIQIFNSWYDKNSEQAKPIDFLIKEFNKNGNNFINASTTFNYKFDSKTWNQLNLYEKESILLDYRLAFLCNNIVNWCPDLGTVLANDEIKNGKSERGGYPVYKKKMLQWHIRISSYAERLIKGLNFIDCSQSLKKLQYNWIGKSIGISILLKIIHPIGKINQIELFTSSPEMMFGMTFIILSTDHPLAERISIFSLQHHKNVLTYLTKEFYIDKKTKNISGIFTGNYVFHPFIKNKKIPIYISNFFTVNNQTKSIIGIPGHEEKSKKFAKKFGIEIIKILDSNEICINSNFLNGFNRKQAKEKIIKILVNNKIGETKTSYKIRDAIFSRQRYWGEPIPIYFKNKIPKTIPVEKLPILLPKIDKFHPEKGKSPLVLAKNWAWDEKNMKIVPNTLIDHKHVFPIETSTMPSWAGSSWYFLRYMDAHNNQFFLDKRKENYWKNVDLYIGGSEHSTGHLIYARFFHKFLLDRGWITTEEPFKKILNQGMILSYSAIILKVIGENIFVSYGLKNKKHAYSSLQEVYVDLSLIKDNNELDINRFKKFRPEFYSSIFIFEKGSFLCKRKLEKMSKSKYNVINPDDIYEKYGSDIFRVYEMFLGPIHQSKPWNEEKINGIKNFINKFWCLFHKNNIFQVNEKNPTFQEFQILHRTIKKIQNKIQSFSWNTSISLLMMMTNQLTVLKCNKRKILEPLVQLLAPFAPHISEELWYKLGKRKSIIFYNIPAFNTKYIVENEITYPIMFNGKLKFLEKFDSNTSIDEIKNKILSHPKTKFFLKKKIFKKLILIPKKVINILFK